MEEKPTLTQQALASLGGIARAAGMTPEELSASGRHAGLISAAKRNGCKTDRQIAAYIARKEAERNLIHNNTKSRGAFGKSNGGKRAKANGGQWHDHRKTSPSRRKA